MAYNQAVVYYKAIIGHSVCLIIIDGLDLNISAYQRRAYLSLVNRLLLINKHNARSTKRSVFSEKKVMQLIDVCASYSLQ